jgi:hypothetical protein
VERRLQMALDAAEGMEFLHGQQPAPMIHRCFVTFLCIFCL